MSRYIKPGIILAAIVFLALPAKAQLSVNFDNPSQVAFPGDDLVFTATVTNTGDDTIFLNGDSLFITDITTDDSPFFTGAPLSLDAGDSFSGEFFSAAIDPSITPDEYTGSFSILGGADASTFDSLTDNDISIDVIPEPSSFELCLGSILFFGMAAFYRRRKSGQNKSAA